MATTVNELPAGSGSKIMPTPGSSSFKRVNTRLYCSVQNAAASSLPPVHSDCNAMRDVRRSTLISLTNSFSLSINTPLFTTYRDRRTPASSAPSSTPAKIKLTPERKPRLISLEVGEQLARRHARHFRRSGFIQRREQRFNCGLELGESSEYAVVLRNAELCRIRSRFGPAGVTSRACDSSQHV